MLTCSDGTKWSTPVSGREQAAHEGLRGSRLMCPDGVWREIVHVKTTHSFPICLVAAAQTDSPEDCECAECLGAILSEATRGL